MLRRHPGWGKGDLGARVVLGQAICREQTRQVNIDEQRLTRALVGPTHALINAKSEAHSRDVGSCWLGLG